MIVTTAAPSFLMTDCQFMIVAKVGVMVMIIAIVTTEVIVIITAEVNIVWIHFLSKSSLSLYYSSLL